VKGTVRVRPQRSDNMGTPRRCRWLGGTYNGNGKDARSYDRHFPFDCGSEPGGGRRGGDGGVAGRKEVRRTPCESVRPALGLSQVVLSLLQLHSLQLPLLGSQPGTPGPKCCLSGPHVPVLFAGQPVWHFPNGVVVHQSGELLLG
jgi:hypothetical protein